MLHEPRLPIRLKDADVRRLSVSRETNQVSQCMRRYGIARTVHAIDAQCGMLNAVMLLGTLYVRVLPYRCYSLRPLDHLN